MLINADFSLRVAVHAGRMDWVPSPMAGVERRMLDRIGEEVARATSLVRYAPGSAFSAHSHDGGEEFLVIEGIFQDEHGDYPVGAYVRNPPGTSHTPRSAPGCVILVKLHQFDPADRVQVRIETANAPWEPVANRPGVTWIRLFRDMREDVRIERWEPGAAIELPCEAGCEALVLAGSFQEGGEHFETDSWLRLPAGGTLQAQAGPDGTQIYMKTGHLRRVL